MNTHTFEIDARPNRLWVDNRLAHVVKVGMLVDSSDGSIHVLAIDEQGAGGGGEADGMIAPMPGKVLETMREGDVLKRGRH